MTAWISGSMTVVSRSVPWMCLVMFFSPLIMTADRKCKVKCGKQQMVFYDFRMARCGFFFSQFLTPTFWSWQLFSLNISKHICIITLVCIIWLILSKLGRCFVRMGSWSPSEYEVDDWFDLWATTSVVGVITCVSTLGKRRIFSYILLIFDI